MPHFIVSMVRPALFLIVLLSFVQARAQTPGASPSAMPMVSGTPTPASSLATQPATPLVTGTVPVRLTYSRVNVDGPYIAMTFDDGPSGPNTPKLLDLAAQKHIKLTFFLIGENAAHYPQLVQRELAEGHQVGNHSYTHPDLAKMTDDAIRSEIQKTQ